MKHKEGYSKLIRPALYLLDLLIITLLSYFFVSVDIVDLFFLNSFWIILSISFSFYEVYRFTKVSKVITLIFKQTVGLILVFIAYLYFKQSSIVPIKIVLFFLILFVTLNSWRIFLHFILRRYRIITGSNYKKVVVIGSSYNTNKLIQFFNSQPGYGYKFIGFFTNNESEKKIGNIQSSFNFVIENDIDEVYCSVKELSDDLIKNYIDFCDINMKTLKFIPDNKELFSKNLHLNYYDLLPVLSLRKIPLEDRINYVLKRLFDIFFSLLVICLVLSWLIPVLGIIIKWESKGPIFFRQNRPGIKEKGFGCYKFRSMGVNTRAEDSATRNDPRVTRVGKFIRKTSIDELPQFFNVLFGQMSVVGPRPHLWRQNEEYAPNISKYMVRYFVKPGITGLAQVRGYRGEIETKSDIVNRTKYDVFYIENWSFLMDINIIIQTVLNVIKGEEKAY